MEFLEGATSRSILEQTGVLAVADAVDYVIQACDAIAEAHGYGIVHRDIKPANLFLGKRPNGLPLVKVLDFGISKSDGARRRQASRKTTAAMGSALYMSPEQMQQTRAVDHRTDIYALGISLYELLAGRQPFYADTMPQLCAEISTGTPTPIRTLRPEVPEGLADVMEKAYARDRGLRFQSVSEFVVALAPYAPALSQPVIDSVCRLANVDAPKAGATPARKSLAQGGTQLMAGVQAPIARGPEANRTPRQPMASEHEPRRVVVAETTAPRQHVPTPPSVVQASEEMPRLPVASNAGVYLLLGMVGVLALGSGGLWAWQRARAAAVTEASTTSMGVTAAAAIPSTPSLAAALSAHVAVEAAAVPTAANPMPVVVAVTTAAPPAVQTAERHASNTPCSTRQGVNPAPACPR